MEVIYVVVGILIGFAVSSIIRRKHPVGFLRIDKSDPDGPYLFLELKKNVNEIIAQRTVLLEVKREDFIPHKYFESTIEKVIQAEYHLNRNFMFAGVIPLNDFYEFLGLEKTELGDAVGWSSCNGDIYLIDFNHHRLTLDDGMEIYVIDMVFELTAEWMEDL